MVGGRADQESRRAGALAAMTLTTSAVAQSCHDGKTLTEGKLTIATGNPAYYPWVMDDSPESGEGFEAAVAYALAEKMGFSAEDVVWTRTTAPAHDPPGGN